MKTYKIVVTVKTDATKDEIDLVAGDMFVQLETLEDDFEREIEESEVEVVDEAECA